MKVGDSLPVTIAGQVVAQATIKELGDGTVTILVPGTLVVMGVRTEIAPEVEAPVETRDTVITGVDRVNADGAVVDSTTVPDTAGTPEVKAPEPTAPGTNSTVAPTVAPTESTTVETVESTSTVVSDAQTD